VLVADALEQRRQGLPLVCVLADALLLLPLLLLLRC
jgi:hypothetical protein